MDKSTSFLIVGAGTFGLSTAWHLATKGYTNVKVIDRWAPPSLASAGYDVSKVVRTEYPDPVYSKLAQESIEAWESLEPFASSGVFHKTGCLLAASSDKWARVVAEYVALTRKHGDGSGFEELADPDSIRRKVPQFDGELDGWTGVFNTNGGWVEARRAMEVLADECKHLGVTFLDGKSGAMEEISYDGDGKLLGIRAEDGTVHSADKIIIATGGWSESLLDFKGQLISGTYLRVHLQLTPTELSQYKDIPVVLLAGQGYFFPPAADGVFKTCASVPTQTYLVDGWRGRPGKTSVPRDPGLHPDDIQPIENQTACKETLTGCLPHLATKEVQWSKLCYDTECVDDGFIISPHPSAPTQLYLATAGSGHAFKNLPILGKYVIQMLEGALSDEHKEAWRWRPDIVGTDRDTSKNTRHVDLSELTDWMKGNDPGVP